MALTKLERRERIRKRIRKVVSGTNEVPRLSVYRSNTQIYVQLVDDVAGKTLLSVSSLNKDIAAVAGTKLTLQLGYSHDIVYDIPKGIEIKCEKPTAIAITGFDKQLVGSVGAQLREYRKPEPYKGKGVLRETEFIIRKEGKKK